MASTPSLQLPEEKVEETDEYSLVRNRDGALVKTWKHAISTPGWVDFLIKNRSSWEEYKSGLTMNPSRVEWDKELVRCNKAREQGFWVRLVEAIGYDRVQAIVGQSNCLRP